MKYPYLNSPALATPIPQDEAAISPREVIRGETTPSNNVNGGEVTATALVDYLSFTVRHPSLLSQQCPLREELINIFGIPSSDWKGTDKGWQGYKSKIALDNLGVVAFGGISQRDTVHVSLNGHGCSFIQDWQLVYNYLQTVGATLTRVDVAHDDIEGSYVNISNALRWESEGLYSESGRPPKTRLIDDRGHGTGKTFYVGSRKNGKFGRIYEKGKQLGDSNSPWCRAEVEFKNKDRYIPLRILLNPGHYLSGAYEPFRCLSQVQSRIATRNKSQELELARKVAWAKSVCGQLINVLCVQCDENHSEVILQIRRPGIPASLEPYLKQLFIDRGVGL